MTHFVTGGTGLLGRSVLRLMAEAGCELALLVPPGARPGGLPASWRVFEGAVSNPDDLGILRL